jgi:hypothetical protein
MANETEFVNGLIVKAPNENAPEYVKAKVSIKREELIAWLQSREGEWINADVKVSQGGKWYVAVDSWKPNQGGAQNQQRPAQRASAGEAGPDSADDDIPF